MDGRWPAVTSWLALLVAGLIGAAPLLPPRAAAVGADATEFSAARAFDTIEAIAREPHPMGSSAIRVVRSEIVARIEALGLEPELQTMAAPDYYGVRGRTVEVVNVLARIPGTAPTGAVALVGHYDSDPFTPGANDNAAAVAAILEAARALLAGEAPRNDVILVFTDGEEPAPRYGSTPFVREHPWASEIGFVVNLEAIGGSGPSLLLATNGPGRWAIDGYAAAVPHPAAFSFLTATADLIGGSNTDFAPFRDAGIPGLEMAYLHGSPIYHTFADAPDRVSLRSVQQHGANTLALARHFGDLDLAVMDADDESVFFTLGPGWVVRYPAAWGMPLVLLAGAVLLVAAWRGRTWRSLLRTAGFTLLTVLGAAVAGAVVWMVLAGVRDRMGIVESYLYLVGLVALTVGAGAAVRRWTGRRPDAIGVVAAWWVMALLLTPLAAGIGYLFLWPALAGAGVLLWWSERDPGPQERAAGGALVAGTALVLLIPAIDVFYQLAQPRPGNADSQILWVVFVPVLMIGFVVEMVRGFGGPVDRDGDNAPGTAAAESGIDRVPIGSGSASSTG